jgi:predicted dehydrogenase
MNRRDFVKKSTKTTLAFGAGLTILGNSALAFGSSANEKINLGFIGMGGRGRALLGWFLKRSEADVNVLYCCDPQQKKAEQAVKIVTDSPQKQAPKTTNDIRTVLDDSKVDAVVCAMPDHWHALGCIWACQAGKDVLTEKPASHSAWEGQKMVDAARKYKRIVQHGTQTRSASYAKAAKKYIENGNLGKIHLCRIFSMKEEGGNFKLDSSVEIPSGVDWDRWLGPAPMRPFSPSYIIPNHWHHLWDFSSGDMIVDGIHQIDLARWVLGLDLPKTVYSNGGRFHESGDAQTPDTQITTYEYDNLMMTFEMALYTPYILKSDNEVRNGDIFPYWMQNTTRIEIYGSEGMMMLGRHGGGWVVFTRPKSRQPVVKDSMYGRYPDPEHIDNFLSCIRSRNLPNADIEQGHRSTLLAHYATISYRLGGQKIFINGQDGTIRDNVDAQKYYKREYRGSYEIPNDV